MNSSRSGEKLRRVLMKIFNRSSDIGYTPQEWNEETVKLLHKGGDSNIKQYRQGIYQDNGETVIGTTRGANSV